MWLCDKRWYSCEMSWWYLMLFLAVVRSVDDIWCLFSLRPYHGWFKIVWCWGWWRGGHALACMLEWVREKEVAMEYMLRRGESSCLCVKCEFAFFACHCILIRLLPLSFLALFVNELCLLFWPNRCYENSCTLLFMRFPNELMMRFEAFGCIIFEWDFVVRVQAFTS
jgi:hypothetical protein